MRIEKCQRLARPEQYKKKLLLWAQKYDTVIWLDSNDHQDKYSRFDAILAVGTHRIISVEQDCFNKLREFQNKVKDYIFGYFTYDLKNEIENLESNNPDGLQFPNLYFFQPKKIFILRGHEMTASYLSQYKNEIDSDLLEISKVEILKSKTSSPSRIGVKMKVFKDEYFEKVEEMLRQIQLGNIYEANLCQEFYSEDVLINPMNTYQKLNKISRPPFAAYLKLNDKYVLCASPERFLQRFRNNVISQPIKGTSQRSKDLILDQYFKENLENDEKEISENVMIVDMVRNDLSQTAVKGTVKVEELCKVYTFPQVHQMISTISSMVSEDTASIDIIKTTFPMGSMTGAPKVSAMKIIENLENSKRGIYSGAIGYFQPNGDFDLNVVIRSILYNETNKYVSYSVGSAITAKSKPAKEYEECLLKAKAMREALESL